MGFLASIAFTAFGKQISWKAIMYAVFAVIIAVILWFAYDKVHDHFQHITDLETANKTLTNDKAKLTSQLDQVKQINRDNAATTKATSEQKDAATGIGNEEVSATQTRDRNYQEIKDVIKQVPVTDHRVDPIITHTLDSLWEEGPAAVQPK